ncbi:glycoside hydrolase family 76 protein [Humibacter ginsengisoli]
MSDDSSNTTGSARPAGPALSRRMLLSAGAGLAGAAAILGTAAPAMASTEPDAQQAAANGRPGGARTALQRADATWQAFATYLLAPDGTDLAMPNYPRQPGDNPYAYEWPHSQVHVGALDLAGAQPGHASWARLNAMSTGQEHYWEPTSTTGLPGYASYVPAPLGGGGDLFYDDNEWVGLEKVQLHLMTGDRAALQRAEQIFALVRSGWDTDASHPSPGGIFWTQASYGDSRNTCSNAPAALIAARLYEITRNSDYLAWAQRIYDWTYNTLFDSTDSMYSDNISNAGTVTTMKWTYNQGMPIAAGVALYRLTNDPSYLRKSVQVAEASYDYYIRQGQIANQPLYFNSIYFKSLLYLESVTGERKYYQAMADYGDHIWTAYRDAATGLFAKDTPGVAQAIEQGAAVQIYSALAWDPRRWELLY